LHHCQVIIARDHTKPKKTEREHAAETMVYFCCSFCRGSIIYYIYYKFPDPSPK